MLLSSQEIVSIQISGKRLLTNKEMTEKGELLF